MSSKRPSYKSAVVCMVYDGYEYLSEFLSYYLEICDHIYVIDHKSERDLRQVEMENVTFIRSNHEAQFQSECTNLVIEHYGIKKNYDWVFVLDVDEFLPFSSKDAFQEFLHKHRNDCVVKFHWRNGVPFYDEAEGVPTSLINCESLRFFHKPGRQYKSFVNIKKTKGLFFVTTGAHTIGRILTPFRSIMPVLKNRKTYISALSNLTLWHVVAFNKVTFVEKIKNYVKQMEYREHVAKQGGGVVRDYPDEYTDDEWLWYIGNFRVTDPDQYYEVELENFARNNIFDHLDADQVIQLRERIMACPITPRQEPTLEEQKYLSYKSDDREVLENTKWFRISPENEIQSIIPELKL